MFEKLFGGGLKKSKVPPAEAVPAPPTKVRKLLSLPETADEWRRVRLTDSLAEQALGFATYLNPRRSELKQARIDRKLPKPGEEILTDDMGGGEFTITPSEQRVMSQTTLDALKAESQSVVTLIAQDEGGDDAEGVMVFHPTHGGIGVLPAKDNGLFNSLLLNLDLRTGHFGRCNARVEEEENKPVVRLDLARYEICYNRCQRILHELNAGAQYDQG